MSWLKKQLNKIFYNEIDEEDDNYEHEKNEEQNKSDTFEAGKDHQSKRTTFRFPLIADEEIDTSQNVRTVDSTIKSNGNYYELPNQKQQKFTDSQVYDVEVSGIRELLEKRKKSKGSSTVLKSNSLERNQIVKAKSNREMLRKEPVVQEKQVVKKEIIVPTQSRKRFIPTDVPSPVHGFSKPKPINDLLTKKQEEKRPKEETLEITDSLPSTEIDTSNKKTLYPTNDFLKAEKEIASTVVESELEGEISQNLSEVNEISNDRINLLNQELSLEIEEVEMVEEKPIIVQSELYEQVEQIPIFAEEVIEATDTTVVNHMEEPPNGNSEDIERLLGAIEEVNPEEEFTQEEEIDEIESVNLEVELSEAELESLSNEDENYQSENENTDSDNIEEKQKGSKLPFNVLMLKSDKEKLAAKSLQSTLVTSSGPSIKASNTEIAIQVTGQEKNEIETVLLQNEQLVEVTTNQNGHFAEIVETVESIEATEPTEPTESVESIKPTEAIESLEPIEVIKSVESLEIEEKSNEIEILQTAISEPEVEPVPAKVYVKPSLEFLSPEEEKTEDREWMESQGEVLVEALSHFQVAANVESIMQGPAVTQFEITVGHGTKVSKIRNLADDLKLALAAKDIRIQAPIPGKSSIGIEIPNRISRAVRLSEVTNSESFQDSESPLEAALGLDLTGKPVTIDLRKMPHGLIAGATGSGKSVCINSILVSLLYKADPHELKLMLIDPKMVELAPFNHIPHLVSPVITDVKAATAALKWAVDEMERRYQLFAHAGVRDLPRYNKLADSKNEHSLKLPYILIVIDELADLMMMSPADVEEAICRIAQKARACGIHLIVATQRPSVDVITGLIKSNIPTRIAFAVSSQIDSRTILDAQGAERLLGRGDMLYLGNGMSAPVRIQGTFVTDDEIEEIIDHVREQGEPAYFFEHEELLKKTEMIEEQDELFEEVCRFAFDQGTASTSSIQRKYHIGYNRAARLIDMLEKHGYVSEQRGSKPREVYITESDLASMFD